ncbi:TPA: hypothetical protein QBZ60_000440 [Pasteurella multocida]|uniref:hypothetical protein n=1 Tax=Pasteurella multocida TaxID=747 RepID=UPI0028DD911D|nr:hypothetical protein [Pasteurella multocida]HDR0618784.1 hypothetical protein [Pasteurella multocida]
MVSEKKLDAFCLQSDRFILYNRLLLIDFYSNKARVNKIFSNNMAVIFNEGLSIYGKYKK